MLRDLLQSGIVSLSTTAFKPLTDDEGAFPILSAVTLLTLLARFFLYFKYYNVFSGSYRK